MTKKTNGENEESEPTVEDISAITDKILNQSQKITTLMNELEEKVDGFNKKYEKFFNEMPVMIGIVKNKLEKFRSAMTEEELVESVYYIPFWEGYLGALLWVEEVVKKIDAEVLDEKND